jgi:hypothetical protein
LKSEEPTRFRSFATSPDKFFVRISVIEWVTSERPLLAHKPIHTTPGD